MRTTGYDFEINVRNESVESLLLMAVLGQDSMKQSALNELTRRKSFVDFDDMSESFQTNLGVIC